MQRLRYLDQGLALSPATLRQIVSKIDPSRLDTSLSEDRFTLREVFAHLADLEPVIRGRMQLALSSPGADVANFDQDEESVKKAYSKWEVEPTLDLFASEREKTVSLYRSLTEEQQCSTVRHPILGQLSIYDLAVFALGHDVYHLDQAAQYL